MTPRTLSALVLFLGLALAASASAPMVAPEGSGGGFGYHDRSRQDTTLYESSFDSGFEDWTSVDNTAQLSTWHVDPFNPVDGTWNWWSADAAVGGYVNHSLLYLEFPPIDLSATANPELSFDLYYGEMLGIAGLVGSGRSELARAVFGIDRLSGGSVSVDGEPVRLRTPRDALEAGVVLVPEDRKQEGLVMGQSVAFNAALPWVRDWIRGIFPDYTARDAIV